MASGALFALAPCLLAGAPLAGDGPERAEAGIGELTLAYDPDLWRIEGGGEALTITCMAEACEGASFDMTATPDPGGYCGKETARIAAEALFTFADRHPANLYGPFAIAMAMSRFGPEFHVPTAVFACFTREDITYRLVSRFADPYPIYTGGIALELLAGLAAPPARLHDLRVGKITLAYAGDRWRAAEITLDGAMLTCLPPTCADIGPRVLVGAAEGERDCMAEFRATPWWNGDHLPPTIVAGSPERPFSFLAGIFWSGCRNWVPPRLYACGIHDGMTYTIEAPGGPDCRSGPEVPREAFFELVESARVAE